MRKHASLVPEEERPKEALLEKAFLQLDGVAESEWTLAKILQGLLRLPRALGFLEGPAKLNRLEEGSKGCCLAWVSLKVLLNGPSPSEVYYGPNRPVPCQVQYEAPHHTWLF